MKRKLHRRNVYRRPAGQYGGNFLDVLKDIGSTVGNVAQSVLPAVLPLMAAAGGRRPRAKYPRTSRRVLVDRKIPMSKDGGRMEPMEAVSRGDRPSIKTTSSSIVPVASGGGLVFKRTR